MNLPGKDLVLNELQQFEMGARSTGRTMAMIQAAKPGSVIIALDEQEARRIRNLLQDAGKEDVKVSHCSAYLHKAAEIGARMRRPVILDHSWVYKLFRNEIEATNAGYMHFVNDQRTLQEQKDKQVAEPIRHVPRNPPDWG